MPSANLFYNTDRFADNRRVAAVLVALLCAAFAAHGQVQVRNEPRHHNVIENKYFRVLDVHIPAHDTTQWHIHSTPSVVLLFSNTLTATQLQGQQWVPSRAIAGNVFYADYGNKPIIHRVADLDTIPFHVTDIELLSPWQPGSTLTPLPFTLLFNEPMAFAYRLTEAPAGKQLITNRGPMIAGLVTGDDMLLHDTTHNQIITIKAGSETYIPPGISFYLSATSSKSVNLVLFELK